MPEFETLNVPIRIGLLADTHRSSRGPRALPSKLLSLLDDCDVIFHAGDVNAPWVLEVLERIAPVYAVRGNNEEPPLDIALPRERLFNIGTHRVGLMHGQHGTKTAREAVQESMPGRVDCVVYGHSHQPEIEMRGDLLMINPGSPTQRRWSPHNTCAIMNINDSIQSEILIVD